MNVTLSLIKADIGSIGGHIAPSRELLDTVRTSACAQVGSLLTDFAISHTGDNAG